MAVDVATLIPSLKREVNPPGTDLYPGARDEEWFGHLQDSFWEARLNGLLAGYTEDGSGQVTPISGTEDLGRELQQLVVLWAGYRITISKLNSLRTLFSVQAGAVRFETQQSATALREVLLSLKERLTPVVAELKAGGNKGAAVLDAVIERTFGQYYGDQWWLR